VKSNKNNKIIIYWKTASEKDFQAAQEILEKTTTYVTVLFYIHLAVEKILKAYYVQKMGKHAPFSHNLLFLIKSAGLEITEKNRKLLSEINEFNIECRYPDDKFNIYKKATNRFTEKYLKKASIFIEWVLAKLDN